MIVMADHRYVDQHLYRHPVSLVIKIMSSSIFIIYSSYIHLFIYLFIAYSPYIHHLSTTYLPYIHPSIQLLARRRAEFSGAASELVTDIKGPSEVIMLF